VSQPSPNPLLAGTLEALVQAGAQFARATLDSHASARVWVRQQGPAAVEERHGRQVRVEVFADGGWGRASGPWGPPAALLSLGRQALELARRSATLSPGGPPFKAGTGQRGTHCAGCGPSCVEGLDAVAAELSQAARGARDALRPSPDLVIAYDAIVRANELQDTEGAFIAQRQGWSRLKAASDAAPWSVAAGDGRSTAVGDPLGGWRLEAAPSDLPAAVGRVARELGEEVERSTTATAWPTAGRTTIVLAPDAVARVVLGTLLPGLSADRVLGERLGAGAGSFVDLWDLGSTLLLPRGFHLTMPVALPGWASPILWDGEGVRVRDRALVSDGTVMRLLGSRSHGLLVEEASPCGCVPPGQPAGIRPALMELRGAASPHDSEEDMDRLVRRGLRIAGCEALTVDDLGLTFTFRGSRAWELRDGKRARRVRPPLLRATTPAFWLRCAATGSDASATNFAFAGLPDLPAGVGGCRAPAALFEDVEGAAP